MPDYLADAMVIDTSALVAILRAEDDAAAFVHAIEQDAVRRLSAASYVGLGAVIDGSRDPVASRRVDELLGAMKVTIEPVSAEQARLARAAYADFGRGSGHRAALNYGDCFAYALARACDEPLLFKGDDFAHTDIAAVSLTPRS